MPWNTDKIDVLSPAALQELYLCLAKSFPKVDQDFDRLQRAELVSALMHIAISNSTPLRYALQLDPLSLPALVLQAMLTGYFAAKYPDELQAMRLEIIYRHGLISLEIPQGKEKK